jgi:hypothetical protein
MSAGALMYAPVPFFPSPPTLACVDRPDTRPAVPPHCCARRAQTTNVGARMCASARACPPLAASAATALREYRPSVAAMATPTGHRRPQFRRRVAAEVDGVDSTGADDGGGAGTDEVTASAALASAAAAAAAARAASASAPPIVRTKARTATPSRLSFADDDGGDGEVRRVGDLCHVTFEVALLNAGCLGGGRSPRC